MKVSRYFKSHALQMLISLLIFLPFLIYSVNPNLLPLDLIDRLEYGAYDLRLNIFAPHRLDPRIVIIDVDDKSLTAEGRWPWPRDKLARLVSQLFTLYGVAIAGFDFVFAEADESATLLTLDKLVQEKADPALRTLVDEIRPELQRDEAFARQMQNFPVVLGYYFNHNPDKPEQSGRLPEPLLPADFVEALGIRTLTGYGYGANLPILQDNATTGGFFDSPLIDDDGVLRRTPLLQTFNGDLYDSLALAIARVYLDQPMLTGENNEEILIGSREIPVDGSMSVLIPYRGGQGNFHYISASDVIHGQVEQAERLKDAIVLVGTTAPGLFDLMNTPLQKIYPGVEVHASIISGILDGEFLHRPAYAKATELPTVLFIGLLMTLLLPRLSARGTTLLSLLLFVVVVSTNLYFWQQEALVLPLAYALLLILALYIFNTSYGFMTTERARRQLKTAFSSYVAPSIVEQLVEHPERLKLSGEQREMSFIFTDLADFTRMSEVCTPEQLVEVLNEYLDNVCRIIMDCGGTVDKIVGDAIIGFFNAPLDQADHPGLALHCALELDRFSLAFAQQKSRQNLQFGRTRIGVNTGDAVVGNFGGHRRFDYTAYGDTINTAARLESVNKYFGTRICVAASCAERCPQQLFRPIGKLVLKGKHQAVMAFEPVIAESGSTNKVSAYQKAFAAMKNNAKNAEEVFRELRDQYPDDSLITYHLQRLQAGETGIDIVLSGK